MTRHPHGFTLAEAVISVAIVGLMLVAAINMLGTTAMTARLTVEHREALTLAEDLMAEILAKPYSDLQNPGSLGTESGEASGGTRANFDDADDYASWSASPPELANGTPIAGYSRYTRAVRVAWVKRDSSGKDKPNGSDVGLLRIDVTVSTEGREHVTLTGFKASGFTWLADAVEVVQ